jgi:hypothetical protein
MCVLLKRTRLRGRIYLSQRVLLLSTDNSLGSTIFLILIIHTALRIADNTETK